MSSKDPVDFVCVRLHWTSPHKVGARKGRVNIRRRIEQLKYNFLNLISETRFIGPHDINLILLGCRLNRQLTARVCECCLGIALPPEHVQPSLRGPNQIGSWRLLFHFFLPTKGYGWLFHWHTVENSPSVPLCNTCKLSYMPHQTVNRWKALHATQQYTL